MTEPSSPAAKSAKVRWPWLFLGIIVGLLIGIPIGIPIGNDSAGSTAAHPATSTTVPSTYHYSATTSSTVKPPPIQKGDFTIGLKTVSKNCFGSAGCNLVVEPNITYAGAATQLTAYGTCSITYTITGGESGDIVETARGTGGMQYRVSQSVLQTKSSGVTPSATVTDVTCS
jgi:hypothetical protein